MRDQSFRQAVIESRLFYRRTLAERLAVAMIRRTGGWVPVTIARDADHLAEALFLLEDRDLITMGTHETE